MWSQAAMEHYNDGDDDNHTEDNIDDYDDDDDDNDGDKDDDNYGDDDDGHLQWSGAAVPPAHPLVTTHLAKNISFMMINIH